MRVFYHAGKKNRSYFEGWYFKQTTGKHALALIPSLHTDARGNRSAMLQFILDQQAFGIVYPIEEFEADRSGLFIRLGENLFGADGLSLRIDVPGLFVTGALRFGPLTPIRGDIMGPFRHIPFMQCNHGVISMAHTVRGALVVNGQDIPLDGGLGYIEMDWGQSFPEEYCWTQCNGFAKSGLSLMASAATIPFGPASFTGCLCAIHLEGREHRLATYRGARVTAMAHNRVELCQGRYAFSAECLAPRTVVLKAPAHGVMGRTIEESPACAVRYRFVKGGVVLFDETSHTAGFEHAKCSK